MGISSINIAMGTSYGAYNQKLSESTKQKLEELGIQYNSNITETQAQKLISTFQAQKNAQNEKKNTSSNNNQQNDLFERAKKLAQKIGINVSEKENFESLIQKIETNLEQKISTNKNNMTALKELQSLSSELSLIQAQGSGSMGYNNQNQALMDSLEALSLYNKNYLLR